MSPFSHQLLSLLEDSTEFTRLSRHFNRFNPLKVLAVDQFEIRHSNVLAWLLDPNGNHDLGTFFVKKLLAKTFVNPENVEYEERIANYDTLALIDMHLHDLEVYKEQLTHNGKRIDLLAVSESNRVALLIENKFRSVESEGQLEEYIEYVKEVYPTHQVIPIFLTLQNERPTHSDYLMLGYDDVLAILKDLLLVNKSYMNREIYYFLTYYVDILSDTLEEDEARNELALSVYRNHKDAVDVLYSSFHSAPRHQVVNHRILEGSGQEKDKLRSLYLAHRETIDFIVKVGDSLILEAFKRFIEQQQKPAHLYNEHFKRPSFVEAEWHGLYTLEDLRERWWLNEAFIAWFERVGDRLKLSVEVGPLHQEKRVALLRSLEAAGVAIREYAYEEGRKYTNIYSSFIEPANWDTKEAIADAMSDLYTEAGYQQLVGQIRTAIGLSTVDKLQQTSGFPMQQAFFHFIESTDLAPGQYYAHKSLPRFVEKEWTVLPDAFHVTDNYWLGHPLIAWFEKSGSGLRLFVEIGPISPSDKRRQLLSALEAEGLSIRSMAYEDGRKYTKILSLLMNDVDVTNPQELADAMGSLYSSEAYRSVRDKIRRALDRLV